MKTHVIPPGFYPDGALVFEINSEYVVMNADDLGNHHVWFTTVPTNIPVDEFMRHNEAGEYHTLGSSQVSDWKDALSVLTSPTT